MMKKCKVCQEEFSPFNTLQAACGVKCAIELTASKKKKKYKDTTRRMRREFRAKDRGFQTKLAQDACNAYVRERDIWENCISCGSYNGKMNAGHYLSAGAHPELRFEEDNIHKQCERCNSSLSGNIVRYRPALIEKIGTERVKWLEGPHEMVKRSIEDLVEIQKHYKAKLKELREL